MGVTEDFLHDGQGPMVKRLRLGVATEGVEQPSQVVETTSRRNVAWAEIFLGDVQRATQ